MKTDATACDARRLALDLLGTWSESEAKIDQILADCDHRKAPKPEDRALIQALVLGVLRHGNLLDLWIDALRDRGRLRDQPRWILRLGLVQLLVLGLPEHAAVHETVALGTPRERPLLNAILRRAIREKQRLRVLADAAAPAVRWSLPAFLVEKWQRHYGAETCLRLCRAAAEPAPVIVRLNRLHPDATPPSESRPLLDWPDFFHCHVLPREALAAGHVYAQDPATSLAPRLLAACPGETVLDACAAPGGKTALLARQMENRGRLIAVDAAASRLERLRQNLSRLGVTCAEVHAIDWTAPPPSPPGGPFDRILLDVPCSNTGVLRRRVDARWRLGPASIRGMVALQRRIISSVVPLLRTGGRLVYSTCSIETEENEEQSRWVEETFSGLILRDQHLLLPVEPEHDGAFAAVFEKE